MNENQETVRTVVYSNIPPENDWYEELTTLFLCLEYPIRLVFDDAMEMLINTGNVYFRCDAPNGKAIVAACNSLFRALLSLSVAIEGEQVIKL